MKTTTTAARLTAWEALLNKIKAWETTSTKETVSDMWEDLHTIKKEAVEVWNINWYSRAADAIDFMKEHFHTYSEA